MRELIGDIRARLGRALTLEFRMDAAFFQQNLLKLLNRLGCFYAVKVPLCRWIGVKALIAAQARWTAVTGDIDCFEPGLSWRSGDCSCGSWSIASGFIIGVEELPTRSVLPDDGYFEYSAVATNLTLTPQACGPSPPAAARRKRPSPNSRANLPSTWCPPITTAPTAPGSNSPSSRIT